MHEVKPPKKPLIYYYVVVALALLQPCVKVLKRLKSGQGHGH